MTNRDERQRTLDAFAAVLDDGAASSFNSSEKGDDNGVDWPVFAEKGACVLEEEEGGRADGGELKGLAAFVRGAV